MARTQALSPAPVAGTTRVVGILGDPVDHSLSPRMHNAAYAAAGLDYVYVPFRATAATIRGAVRALRTLGIVGFNVTVPFKQDVVRLVDRLTPTAEAIGAVNTVYRDGDDVVGDNTDAFGFSEALRSHGVRVRGARVLVIGAGGSARAVLHALGEGGAADVVLANRTRAKAARLVREFGGPAPGAAQAAGARGSSNVRTSRVATSRAAPAFRAAGLDAAEDAALLATRTLVVNCTPVGLKGGDYLGYAAAATPKACVHFDLAYGQGLTPFLALAARHGRPVLDGRWMLAHQGAAAYRRFTGRKAPVDVMLAAIGAPARAKPRR